MQDFFNRFSSSRGKREAFRGWQIPDVVQSIPVVEPRGFREMRLVAPTALDANKYTPAVVIGLGSTGDQVVREWLDLVGQDTAGYQENLRVILISQASSSVIEDASVSVRQFDLLSSGAVQTGMRQPRSQREAVYLLFRQAANYQPFEQYLHVCLTELKQGLHIFVVGSAAEYEIGLLGPVLQAIRLAGEAGIGAMPAGVVALLTLGAAHPVQTDAEIYATMREIGRFTFAGTQWMEPPPGLSHGAVHGALADHVLLVEERGNPPHAPDLSRIPFASGLCQAMGEALYALTHPSGHMLLDQLSKTSSADLRAKGHRAVIHSLGIATLYVPLQELQAYAAARLARAIIYAENDDRGWEGLVFRPSGSPYSVEAAESLARSWLRSGPGAHPFFEWLLAAQDFTHFRTIPNLSPEYKVAFKAQVASGLVSLLNDPTQVDRMGQARLVLRWLERRFTNLKEWFRQASGGALSAPERRWFQDFLEEALRITKHFGDEVTAWENVLYPSTSSASGIASYNTPHRAIPCRSWRRAEGNVAEVENSSDLPAGEIATLQGTNLYELFESYRQSAERGLSLAASGMVRRSVLADDGAELKEAADYYQNILRPELSRGNREIGQAFMRVRERMGWWVQMEELPRLFLVCAPPEVSRADEGAPLPKEALWSADQYLRLGETILQLCALQASSLLDELTGSWLRNRFEAQAGFLSRANNPLLQFDQQKAAVGLFRTTHKVYVVGRDKALTSQCRSTIFPNIASADIAELDGSEPSRLTAIAFEYNIPINAIQTLNKCYSSYGHQESSHIYLQEQIAVRYERRIRSFQGWEELPADLTAILVDPQRLSVFCQAFFCGLIGLISDELGQQKFWSVNPSWENSQPFRLAPQGQYGLFEAMRAFVLEQPNSPGLERQFGSPFHPERYGDFITKLWKEARACRGKEDFSRQRQRIEKEYLQPWITLGERDILAKGFANLLKVEMEGPEWKDW